MVGRKFWMYFVIFWTFLIVVGLLSNLGLSIFGYFVSSDRERRQERAQEALHERQAALDNLQRVLGEQDKNIDARDKEVTGRLAQLEKIQTKFTEELKLLEELDKSRKFQKELIGGDDKITKMLMDENRKLHESLAFNLEIMVNYDLPLGAYGASSGFIKDFPDNPKQKDKKEVTFKLFYFGEDLRPDSWMKLAIIDIENKMAKEGFRPATFRELMTFCYNNPGACRHFPINGLGSRAKSSSGQGSNYPVFRNDYGKMSPDWGYFDNVKDPQSFRTIERFLAVKIK